MTTQLNATSRTSRTQLCPSRDSGEYCRLHTRRPLCAGACSAPPATSPVSSLTRRTRTFWAAAVTTVRCVGLMTEPGPFPWGKLSSTSVIRKEYLLSGRLSDFNVLLLLFFATSTHISIKSLSIVGLEKQARSCSLDLKMALSNGGT